MVCFPFSTVQKGSADDWAHRENSELQNRRRLCGDKPLRLFPDDIAAIAAHINMNGWLIGTNGHA